MIEIRLKLAALFFTIVLPSLCAFTVYADNADPVQIGPRPYWLIQQMNEGELKQRLETCAANIQHFERRQFSIAHRGAPLQFPEHTLESYRAADILGAGVQECDVTFTKDGELVCRHAQCDLHTTTNILAVPELANQCAIPFKPAIVNVAGELVEKATARCCASDITLQEYRSLSGKMDAFDPRATTVEQYLGGTANTRTDLYATGGTLLTHRESIALIKGQADRYTPELKSVTDGFGKSGLNQETYASKLIEEYIEAGVPPEKVWPQSFNLDDVLFWIDSYPEFGQQAVYLDGRRVSKLVENPPSIGEFEALKKRGVNIIAPPIPVLLSSDSNGKIIPSAYAKNAKAAGLDIITWTIERSGRLVQDVVQGSGKYYYQTIIPALENDGDIFKVIHVLAQEVGVLGVFSDWPATTTFYANCFDMP